MSQIYEDLVHKYAHIAEDMFHHASPTITAGPPQAQQPQETPVSLSADLAAFQDTLRAVESPLRQGLDQHLPGLLDYAQKLDSSPIVQAVIEAEPFLPQPVNDAVVAILRSHVPAAPAPAPDAQPAEPQPAQ